MHKVMLRLHNEELAWSPVRPSAAPVSLKRLVTCFFLKQGVLDVTASTTEQGSNLTSLFLTSKDFPVLTGQTKREGAINQP